MVIASPLWPHSWSYYKNVKALSLTLYATCVVSSQNILLVTCRPVLFEVKTTHFYLIFIICFCFFVTLILFLLFWFSVKVPIRAVPGRFRGVPGGSG